MTFTGKRSTVPRNTQWLAKRVGKWDLPMTLTLPTSGSHRIPCVSNRLPDPTPSGTKQPCGNSVNTQREGRNTSSFVTRVYTQMVGEGHRTPEHILPHKKLLTAVCKQFTWLKETVHTLHLISHTHTLTLKIEEITVRFEAFVCDSISRIMQG